MHNKGRFPNAMFGTSLRPENAVVAIMLLLMFLMFLFLFITLTATPAQAQTFTVIHIFLIGEEGIYPYAGLTMDSAGNLYGTTSYSPCGDVFKLTRSGSGWNHTSLYTFQCDDLSTPEARVVFGPDGNLYGTTSGQLGGGAGVFKLRRPACTAASCPWTETVLHRFSGGSDGGEPGFGDLIFDQAGNIYGTTAAGGAYGYGTIFKLTPSGGSWTETVLYSFTGGSDGSQPLAGLIFDNVGNLYGTTFVGGTLGYGTVFQLTPTGSGWTENVLYSFHGESDGSEPAGGLIFDRSGNLYGTTSTWDAGKGGTVFKLTPSDGSWVFALLYSFTGQGGPLASLTMDATGNLYGTTYGVGFYGNVFKLTRSGNGWTYTSLHDFTGYYDGANPWGNVILDAGGNIFGTSSNGYGGYPDCCGVAFEITPY